MNKVGLIILLVLDGNSAVNKISAMPLKEIAKSEDFGCKENTLFKQISGFRKDGYVDTGLKDGHASTYYLTKKGLEFVQKVKAGEMK